MVYVASVIKTRKIWDPVQLIGEKKKKKKPLKIIT